MAEKYVIHGNEYSGEHIEEQIAFIRQISWVHEKFKSTPSLNYMKDGRLCSKRPYTGQKVNAEHYEIDPVGWNHEHCEVCWWTMAESEDVEVAFGFTDGKGLWICIECHEQFIEDYSTK